MKKQFMVIPLVFLLCFTFGCQQGEEVAEEPVLDVEADIEAIKGLVNEWAELFMAGDFDGLVSNLYAEDAVRMPPNEPIIKGREAILAGFKKDTEQTEIHIDSSIAEDVRVSGDWALVRGLDTGTNTPKGGGEAAKMNDKWLLLYERQPDGTWKIFYEAWNSNNPLPPPSEKE